jgi:hypothetical protein
MPQVLPVTLIGPVDFGYSMRNRSFIFAVIIVAFIYAYAQPNFSGIWKMNPEKSDWGPQTPPQSAEYVVRHIGAKLAFNYTQDGNVTRVDITPDNEERTTSTTEDTAVWTRAYWSENVLVLESRERKRFGTQAATGAGWTSRWSLSEDGKELIIERTVRNNSGEAKQRMVYTKQPIPRKPPQP